MSNKLQEMKDLHSSVLSRYNAISFQSRWVGGGVSDAEVASLGRYLDQIEAEIRTLKNEVTE
jgi:hypothetical protein